MVLVKRRSSVPTALKTPVALRLPLGDGRVSPHPRPPPPVSPESGIYRSFTFESRPSKPPTVFSLPTWMVQAVAGLVVISWVVATMFTSHANASLQELEYQHELAKLHHGEALKALNDAESARQAMEKEVQQYLQTQQLLEHEQRIAVEMKESGANKELRPSRTVTDFLEQRQESLQRKIQGLRTYIQMESKQEVIEKYGPGPHRVEIQVEFSTTSQREQGSFVLEMAPLEHMPHSVHIFLDTVARRLWDNTAFWHHPGSPHIISAAAVKHHTGEPKIHYFEALNLNGVSFAEYSSEFPHHKYTVGFAGRGPIFYVNMDDNVDVHGPGGQSHHDFDDEADPCFATVVHGIDVVEKMHRLSLEQSMDRQMRQDTWRDNELTRIVRARVLPPS